MGNRLRLVRLLGKVSGREEPSPQRAMAVLRAAVPAALAALLLAGMPWRGAAALGSPGARRGLLVLGWMGEGKARGSAVANDVPSLPRHYPKQSFTMVADTPENLRLKQQSELQSQVRSPLTRGRRALPHRPTFSRALMLSYALAQRRERRVWGVGPSSWVSPIPAVFALPFIRGCCDPAEVGRVRQAVCCSQPMPCTSSHLFPAPIQHHNQVKWEMASSGQASTL